MSEQQTDFAQTCYDRIREAVAQDRTVDAVRDFRVVLESIFRRITLGDPRSFSNLFARIEYVFDQMDVQPLMREQIHSLRILANKLIHEPMPLEDTKYLLSLRVICETVAYFYDAPVPTDLSEHYASLGNRRFVRRGFQAKPKEVLPLLRLLVLEVESGKELPNGASFFIVRGRDEEIGDLRVLLWDNVAGKFSYLKAGLRPYDILQLLNIQRLENTENMYSSTVNTRAILEPDLLLDISELAECFDRTGYNEHVYLLKKLLPQASSLAAFQGNLVNSILDEAVRDTAPDFKTAFQRTVAEKVFMAAAYGRERLNEMYTTIRNGHWANLLATADLYRTLPVRIEPSFFSAQYGMQGRLDLMVEYLDNPMKKDILELKSGRAPDHGLWLNHEIQVVGYNLLLASCFGEGRSGNSAILYSGAPKEPLRNVARHPEKEQRLLELRNEVVMALYQLAADEFSKLDGLDPATLPALAPFTKLACQRFREAWTAASPLKKAYYQAFLSFILREFLNAKCGAWSAIEREEEGDGFAALWLQDEEEKARHFSILRNLVFGGEANEDGFLFHIDGEAQHHNFRAGDTAILYPRTSEGLQPLRQQVVKGRLEQIRNHELRFSPHNHQLDASFFEKHAAWVLEHDIYESNFFQSTQGLFRILEAAGDRLFALISGQQEPGKTAVHPAADGEPIKNLDEVLLRAVAAPDYFLVQGPPGTGKTSTFLTRLVQEELKKPGTIVIVAFTNRAVEEIAGRLSEKDIRFLRLGGRRTADERRLRGMILDKDVEGVRKEIGGHRVFLATVATMMGRLEGLRMLKDDLQTLIVDEASQLTEPQLLPLLAEFRKFILIGDQNQLPPVVTQDPRFCAVHDEILESIGLTDLRYSLFERLIRLCQFRGWHHGWGMLTTHFRMHRDIAALINPWYGGRLEWGRKEQEAPHVFDGPPGPWKEVLSAGRVVFVPSPTEKTSKYHRTEAERVVSLLHYLRLAYGDRFGPNLVGVITPWRTQIGLIRRLMGDDEALQALNIDTVERFQGSENDIIIVSMAVHHASQLELLRSPGKFGLAVGERGMQEIEVDRKLLVTLSRAREQIVMMGDERVVGGMQPINSFVRMVL